MHAEWTEAAGKDLDDLHEYIGEDDPAAAIGQVFRIIEAVEGILTAHPQAGRPGRLHGTREMVVTGTPFIVVYRVKAGALQVVRVLHSSRRWPARR